MTQRTIRQVKSNDAPQTIGPYSQAIAAGDYLFVSGQLPIDSMTGKLIGGGIKEQTLKVIDNLEAILLASGVTLENVVKTEVYVRNMHDFKKINEVYAKKFDHEIMPSRQVVEVSKLPMDADIEISCIAYL